MAIIEVLIANYVERLSDWLRGQADVPEAVVLPSDDIRVAELATQGLFVGQAGSQGNSCLVESIMQIMVFEHAFCPRSMWLNVGERRKVASACRGALVDLPWADVRRPKLRDPTTGQVVTDVPLEAHASAYLQADVHGPFVVFWLARFYERLAELGQWQSG